jgi:plastocyanin
MRFSDATAPTLSEENWPPARKPGKTRYGDPPRRYAMHSKLRSRLSLPLGLVVLVPWLVAAGCGSSGGGGSGSGGAGGSGSGGSGSGGASGSGGSGSGGSTPFTAVAPCKAESDYTTTGTTVMFGGATTVYAPKCLKVSAGTSVTFTGADGQTFADHPLTPSAERGTLTGTPIVVTSETINSKSFTFSTPGYYAYYCLFHGLDSATAADNFMAGVVWVQ